MNYYKKTLVLSLTSLSLMSMLNAPANAENQENNSTEISTENNKPEELSTTSTTNQTIEETTDRMIVKFKTNVSEEDKKETLENIDNSSNAENSEIVKEVLDESTIIELNAEVDKKEQEKIVETLKNDDNVEYAEPDYIVKAVASLSNTATKETLFGSQWNLNAINIKEAWNITGGKGSVIGIVDTGELANHSDTKANRLPGYDFVSSTYYSRDGDGYDNNPTDEGTWDNLNYSNWHGAHVTGIANASVNGKGIAGVAPQAKNQHARALGTSGSGYISDIATAIAWSSGWNDGTLPKNNTPANVINASLSYYEPNGCSTIMQQAINRAYARNVPVVVAAGNVGQDATQYAPANCYGAIVVGATAPGNIPTGYSNYGRMLDIWAPGGAGSNTILSTVSNALYTPGAESYSGLNGTSMASPHVAGTIALMKSVNPNLKVEEIRNALQKTATRQNGVLHLNAGKAVAEVKPKAPTYRVINGIATYYYNNGGINKFGEPVNNETTIIHNGAWQGFSKNYNLYWHDKTGTQSVFMNGAIGRLFKNLGSENFGYPVNSETLTNVNGGVYQEFLNPSNNNRNVIYWSNNTGAYTMFKNGGIYNYWANNGGLQGIGYPITNETVRANGIITQEFMNSNGARTVLSWSDSTGVKAMNGNGDIYHTFLNKGGYATIGAPTTNQVVRNNGIVTQEFVNSRGVKSIFSWTAGTGAKVMNGNGDIYKNFMNKGGYATFGTPLTDEYLVNNSIVAQDFVKGNLKYRAYWSSGTGTSFVYMNGGIYWHWANNGGVDKLGIPITNELVDSQGRVYQKFNKSGKVVTVYWTSSRGAWIQ